MCKDNEHNLEYVETKKYDSYDGFISDYTRIDMFYCTKCGEIITKKKTTGSRERPDWY